jgi:branched-chain amino acid transport system ATP-binding protein
MDEVLSCQEVRVGYGDADIVNGFSLVCRRGEIVALIGPNGCGKSTFLKGAARVLPLRGGRVSVAGRDTSDLGAGGVNALGLQYVPQTNDVFPSLSVKENLFVGRTERDKLDEVMSLFPLVSPLLKRKAGRLSGGERKSVAIARAFMSPLVSVLLLDEPSTGLAPVACERLWPTVTAAAATGVGVVLVEQRVEAALEVADRVYMMVDGRQRLQSDARELSDDPAEIVRLMVSTADTIEVDSRGVGAEEPPQSRKEGSSW